MDLHPFRCKMDDIFIMMKSPDSNNGAVCPRPLYALSSRTDVVVHQMDECCVLQLKVQREHQVNIHWLPSTERNLIDMSLSALTLCPRILPHTNTRARYTVRNAWNTDSRKCTHKDILPHTNGRTRYIANRAADLSRQPVRLSQNNVWNSATSAIISAAQSGQIGSLAVHLNKSRLVKWKICVAQTRRRLCRKGCVS